MSSGIDLSEPWKISHNKVASMEDIFYCFRLLLGRTPNVEEWIGHVANAGNDIDEIVSSYANSLEFSRRLGMFLNASLDGRISLIELSDFSIYVQEGDAAIGQPLKSLGNYEPHVTAVFRDRLKVGMHVVDIGANIGYFTMLSAFLVGPTGSVMAVEPNPANIKMIEASRRANSFNNVSIVQAGAGRELGLLMLNTSYSNGTTANLSENLRSLFDSTTVASLKVDDLIPRNKKINFIKVDVEGAEYNALLGASDIIKNCHPTIVSEFSPEFMPGISGVDGPQYLKFLLDFGYNISVIEQDASLTYCGKDVAKVMSAYAQSGIDHIDILWTKWCNKGGHCDGFSWAARTITVSLWRMSVVVNKEMFNALAVYRSRVNGFFFK